MAAGESAKLTLYTSKETHTWVEKAAELFGLGSEAIRWIEWGMRSYHDFALGLALLLVAAAVARVVWVPRPIAALMALTGLAYLAQGWLVGVEGFSPAVSIAIVLAWVLSLVWMIWLAVVAWRTRNSVTPSPGR